VDVELRLAGAVPGVSGGGGGGLARGAWLGAR
jgi:hypothetical protein